MSSTTYIAAMMDAETGGSANYAFEASMDLLDMPASEIIDTFIKHLDSEGTYPSPMSCHLDSAIVKKDKGILRMVRLARSSNASFRNASK